MSCVSRKAVLRISQPCMRQVIPSCAGLLVSLFHIISPMQTMLIIQLQWAVQTMLVEIPLRLFISLVLRRRVHNFCQQSSCNSRWLMYCWRRPISSLGLKKGRTHRGWPKRKISATLKIVDATCSEQTSAVPLTTDSTVRCYSNPVHRVRAS